jgi:hypothetical protein
MKHSYAFSQNFYISFYGFQTVKVESLKAAFTLLLSCNVTTNVQYWKPKYQHLSILMCRDRCYQFARSEPASGLLWPCSHELDNVSHSIQLYTYNPAKTTSNSNTRNYHKQKGRKAKNSTAELPQIWNYNFPSLW